MPILQQMWRNLSELDRAEYEGALMAERLPSAVRMAAAIIFVLNAAFVGLDAYAFPDLFWNLFAARMALNTSLAIAYMWTSRRFPKLAQSQLVLSAGALLLWVIYSAGAPTTEYYAGLMLLFLGCPLVLPLKASETLLSYTAILTGFLISPWLEPSFAEWKTFTIHALFLGGGAFTGIASSQYLENVRVKEYKQRKEIEEARDRLQDLDRAKSRFTANVHHELRTPLTLTLAPIESMLAGDFGAVSDLQRSYLKTMHVNALRLLKLVSDLLDLAKIESDQLVVKRRRVLLGPLAEELVSGAQPLASRKDVTLKVQIDPDAPVVHADPEAVEKVLMNLIGNALKFTDAGGRIDVHVAKDDDEDGILCTVRDSGIGLEQDQLKRIFDRFAQVDSSATRRHEGTGIGLSLSRELIVLHEGALWAESPGLGGGSSFSFWLPVGESDEIVGEALLVPQEEARHGPRMGEAHAATGYARMLRYCDLERTVERLGSNGGANGSLAGDDANEKPTILICEDNAGMRRLLCDLLSKEFCVRAAEDGREGLEQVRQWKPDLVLTDVMMPEMSGIELCQEIKQGHDTAGIPVVLVTSKAEREMKIAGLETGADDYVTKPFHSRELLARVRSLVRLRRLQEELADQNRALQETNEELASAMQELKQAEAQLVRGERLAAVGELAAGLAHEVNNPVNFAKVAAEAMVNHVREIRDMINEVRGAAQGARRGSDGETPRIARPIDDHRLDLLTHGLEELAGIVNEGLERTGRLVGDLRDLAAPWSGPYAGVDVPRIVESALQLMRYRLQSAGISTTVRGSPVPLVMGEARALGQVFLNILKNAAEALEPSGGSVQVDIREEGGGVVVGFQDDGPGIDPVVVGRLFEPFFSTKPAGKGTGLGLSISRQMIEKHGGRILVSSEPGQGARFTVWLPLGSR